MLSEREVEHATAQLSEFRLQNEQHQKTNAEVLEKYGKLLEDYQRLRSDYEEERENREKYKQLAKGQDRSPFVLVLIDGDGYVFDDDLVSSAGEGGQRAAQLLNEVVKKSLQARGLAHCKIMVRVYANLSGLSKALSKVKLCGPEKRSLAPFVANFNRSNELFDFVDAGELKENADFKLRSLFHLYAENASCKHIYFAACHDVGYINELNPYTSMRDRITLVRNYAFHKEFARLGLRIEDFPSIFRTNGLDYFAPTPSTYQKPAPSPAPKHQNNISTDSTANICTFYQKGLCRYGSACKNLHVKSNGNSNAYTTTPKLSDIRDWRTDDSPNKPALPVHLSPLAKSDNDFMSGHMSFAQQNDAVQNQVDFITLLPREEDIPAGKIPVNREQQRIDAYISPCTFEDRALFNKRTAKRKLCNNHHLKNHCSSGDRCQFDHSPVPEGVKSCLKEVARGLPCVRKGACRDADCTSGHICQQSSCKKRGGNNWCKLPLTMHTVSLDGIEYVDAVFGTPKDAGGWETSDSAKGSSSPPISTTQESDDEGAVLNGAEVGGD